MKDILFIGDSLIEFFDWGQRFPEHNAVNLGISGETVEWLLERMDRITGKHPSADVVFIMAGINNVAMEETGFLAPYRKVLERLRAAYPQARLFVTSLLPTLLPWIDPATILRVNELLSALAWETEATYLDIHSVFVQAGVKECLSPDGIHLSEQGYELWSNELQRILESAE